MSLDPITVTKVWLLVKPFKRFKAWRTERKGKGMALDTGLRTSTNAAAGAGFLGTAYVQLVGLLPYPDLVAALTTPQMIVLVTTFIAWGVARITKTPDQPKAL